jgi:hypothetical protein
VAPAEKQQIQPGKARSERIHVCRGGLY